MLGITSLSMLGSYCDALCDEADGDVACGDGGDQYDDV